MPNHFLISVSNKENLQLCKKYALAGFSNSINGVWTFCDIKKNDFISFLYAARAHNLYRVEEKVALEDAEKLPPWKPVTFKISRKKYYFPFRLYLKPVRKFEEPLIRAEFAYVAENLLLRGGYRKTHFQADQTTLQNVSQMGERFSENAEKLEFASTKFIPRFSTKKTAIRMPYVFPFREIILQSMVRHYLCNIDKLQKFLDDISINEIKAEDLEVLGEKALPEGHVDIFIKQAVPIGESKSILIEIKCGKATIKDFEQLAGYLREFGPECLRAVLIAKDFGKKTLSTYKDTIVPVKYAVSCDLSVPRSFEELVECLKLEKHKSLDAFL
ncbi:MAG: hypothetical protein NWE99_02810 [Candidatus Bathyarchaeota archaeon]|nr:hypothetical protein [Candidatus Bathyarchaeota archaeon]